MLVYLDSSMIIKRYIQEEGTTFVDYLYEQANHGYITLAFNLWNIGEVLGVFDQYLKRQWINDVTFNRTLSKFIDETSKLLRINQLLIQPTLSSLQIDTWSLILQHKLYIADALQIANHTLLKAVIFASGDKHLTITAEKLGHRVYKPEKEKELIKSIGKSIS